MSLTLIAPVSGFATQITHRRADCWKVTPRTGSLSTILVTSHNRPLDFDDGGGVFETYTPQSGFDSSAAQLQSGMREQNRDLLGVISDDRFTHDQLRAGAWDQATITVSTVDWLYPHAGALVTRSYKIGRINHTGTQWTAELSGLTNRLHAKTGRVFARPCDADWADSRCKIDPTSDSTWQVDGVRVDDGTQDSTEPRRIFEAVFSDLSTTSDDFYKYGKLVWSKGQNATIGVVSTIKAYTDSNRKIELYEPTPYAIDDDDEFNIFAGCDKLFATCRDKFSNEINFRGFHLMPGSDHVLRTPSTEG